MKVKFARVGNRCWFYFHVFRFHDGSFRSAFLHVRGFMVGLLR
jgi:hypothetical protein